MCGTDVDGKLLGIPEEDSLQEDSAEPGLRAVVKDFNNLLARIRRSVQGLKEFIALQEANKELFFHHEVQFVESVYRARLEELQTLELEVAEQTKDFNRTATTLTDLLARRFSLLSTVAVMNDEPDVLQYFVQSQSNMEKQIQDLKTLARDRIAETLHRFNNVTVAASADQT